MYGAQLLPLHDASFDDLIRAWRVVTRRVWRVPWRTHSSLLPHLAGVMSPVLWLHKRTLNFISKGINNSNLNVKTVLQMATHSPHSVFGSNKRTLDYRYNFNLGNIVRTWRNICIGEERLIETAAHIKELCSMRDRNFGQPMSVGECKEIISYLCLN